MEHIGLALELFGLVLGIVALALAIWHLREIKGISRETHRQQEEAGRQTTELHSLADRLEEIRGSLSTRYIGEFPHYISDLAHLIGRAEENILICCDIPAYGHFSDRQNWVEYSYEIQKKANDGITIQLACFSEQGRLRNHYEQFSTDEQLWNQWKRDPKAKEHLNQFLKSHKSKVEIEALTMMQFANLLEETDKQMLNGPFVNATLYEIDGYIPMYFWLVDKNEAIFAIPSFTNTQSEYGFRTSDPKLISALVEMGEHYRSAFEKEQLVATERK
jgi:hypothetical protein